MRRVLAVATTAALTLGSGVGLAAAQPSTRAHPLAGIAGTAPLHIKGAQRIGPAHGAIHQLTLVLNQRRTAALRQRIANPSATPLSGRAFLHTYAPSRSEVATVRRWATRHGLRTQVPTNRAFVQLRGSQQALSRALGTSFAKFRQPNGTTYVASVGTARLPAAVRSVTHAVLGLSTLGHLGLIKPQRQAARPAAAVSFPSSYTPQQFWSLYDAPSGQTGSGQTLAIITEGDVSQPKKDLATFEQTFGLPSVTWNTIQVGAASTDTSGDDEWDLDSQYSTGFAPGVTTLNDYNGASLANTDILATINRWVSDDATRQASFSAGECDLLAYATGFTSGLDTVLQQAAAQGQSLFVSSGDNGAFCSAVVGVNGIPAGIPDTEYPASSPDAIGVGGSTVLGSGPTEIAWYAGGGGLSPVESAPGWQSGASGEFLGVRRGVPDVALDADPNSGYDVIVGGQQEVIGGTSASAPSWQGIWAREQGAHGGNVGFAGPVIYQTEPASAFHDITLGGNPIPAFPGWDYATGRGTPDIAAVVSNG